MKQTSSSDVRQQFIDFFKSKGHQFIPSSPVVPQDDPTLLFTNAGMNQFKAIFLGENKDNLKRAANSQKCMRVSGKHNDLEEVGRDHYHHTFFEMLGNWSFGDYYKKEAIEWAWELLTGVWGLPKDRLYATVYKEDNEAIELWKKHTDIAHDRIGRYDAKSNFWEMGETGPCGPCSEIHLDLGEGSCAKAGTPGHVCGVNVDGCARYMELWNLVFMQYNREAGGKLVELPAKHVDTGMGFERVVRVIQGVKSNYDTDVFTPIIAAIAKASGKSYAADEKGTPHRVIADHIRALVFSITDGAFPSNDGRGYVVRRLLRRAFRFGRELGFDGPFLYKLVDVVIEVMGKAFPEIGQRRDYVMSVIKAEEERFGATLGSGIERFEAMAAETLKKGSKIIPGVNVFALYDTYGFPIDLTRLMAEEKGLSVDEAGFEKLMAGQRDRAREAGKKADDSGLSADGWIEVKPAVGTEFVGYSTDESAGSVVRYKPIGEREFLLVLDTTPFYAESGGQVGDTGTMVTTGGNTLRVTDTIKWNDMIVHLVSAATIIVPEEFAKPLSLHIESVDRAATRRNHSATHLLQAALRAVLGNHIQQSGSRVDPYSLRFDFTHFKAVTTEELADVELRVNGWVLDNYPVATTIKKTDEAKADGAMALFGEKYGSEVRVVSMGAVSKELCGGTHVKATGDIGLFHITAESSVAAGIRRIEAVTGLRSMAMLVDKDRLVGTLCGMLKVSEEKIVDRVGGLMGSVKELEQKAAKLSSAAQGSQATDLLAGATRGIAFAWTVKDLGSIEKEAFTNLTNAVSDAINVRSDDPMVVVMAAVVDGKALFFAGTSEATARKCGVHCGELVKLAAKLTGGGGGGNPTRASAGGKDASKINEAIAAVTNELRQKAG